MENSRDTSIRRYSQVASNAVKTEKIRPPKKTALVAVDSLLPFSSLVSVISCASTPLKRIAYAADEYTVESP
jgi:hypothetical protein